MPEAIQPGFKPSRAAGAAAMALLAAGGVAWAWTARHDPISDNPDAVVYVEAADNLLKGNGLTAVERNYTGSPGHLFRDEPLTHYPPLYPLMVAGARACGAPLLEAARGVNLALLGALVLLAGHVVYKATGGSAPAALAAGALLLTCPTALRLHNEAVSEPAFLFLSLAALGALASSIQSGRRAMLVAAAGLAALAWMARYAGVSVVVAGAAALLLRRGAPVRRRLLEAAAFAAIAAGPMVAWVIRNRLVAGTATHRPAVFHPLLAEKWPLAAATLHRWFVPTRSLRVLGLAGLCLAVVAIAAAGAALWRRRRAGQPPLVLPPLAALVGLFAGVYLLVVVLSFTFADAAVSLGERTLLPLYLCLVVAACCLAPAVARASGRTVQVLIAASACLMLTTGLLASARWVRQSRKHGPAPAASIRHSDTMRRLAALPPDTPVYTNAGMLVQFQTGRRVFGLPVHFDPMTRRPNPAYEADLAALREGLKAPGSLVVLFPAFRPGYFPTEAELRRRLDLTVVHEEGGNLILAAPAAQTRPAAPTTRERISRRTFPSAFQAWNGADNLKAEDRWATMARHDLAFVGPSAMGLKWQGEFAGLAREFAPESLPAARSRRAQLLRINPNFVLLAEVRYRDAPPSYLPEGHPWWARRDGRAVAGWEEGGYLQLNVADAEFRSRVAAQAKAAVDSGVFDGVMLDWWTDDDDRLALAKAIRAAVGEDALILVNANDRVTPATAPYVNGYFMECYRSQTPEDWQRIARTLRWAQENLREPRINCLETWTAASRGDLNRMRATTALSLTLSDGYCLFSDPNPLPTPDHLHDWYPFWHKSLGRPAARGERRKDGAFERAFEAGWALYNPMGNAPVTVTFAQPHRQASTGTAATSFTLSPCDGDLFLRLPGAPVAEPPR